MKRLYARIQHDVQAHQQWACWITILLSLASSSTNLISANPDVDGTIQPHQFYEVANDSGKASIDLEFDRATRYVVIVGSLGDPLREYPVRITSAPLDSKQPRTALNVTPFRFDGRRSASRTVVNWTKHVRATKQSQSHAQPEMNVNERSFHIHVTDGSLDDARQYAEVRSRLIETGRTVRVYVDKNQRIERRIKELSREIVRLLDDEIVGLLDQQLGRVSDIDGDGKLAVLLTPWLGKLQGGRTALGGFVRGSDFDPIVESPFGNHADVLYLNTNLRPGSHLLDIIAHELTHAICFSQRQGNGLVLPAEEDWLNEAMAHLSEKSWSNLDYRISRYLENPQNYPLAVADYYQAGLWRDHGCRGATYLFLRWCADAFGEDICRRLIALPSVGKQNIAEATGMSFESLFRSWAIAMYRSLDGPATSQSVEGVPRYRSINLCGQLSNWGLAGPRCLQLDAERIDRTISLKGTSVAFLEIDSSIECQSLTIETSPHSNCFVLIQRLRKPCATTIEAEARWSRYDEVSERNSLLEVSIRGPEPMQVAMLACEAEINGRKRSICFSSGALRETLQSNDKKDASFTSQRTNLRFRSRIRWLNRDVTRAMVKVLLKCSDGGFSVMRVPVMGPPLRVAQITNPMASDVEK